MKMRTIKMCMQMLHRDDLNTAVTEHALRCWIKQGVIPTVKVGKKTLVDYDRLCSILSLQN